jgi:hypothetical protein
LSTFVLDVKPLLLSRTEAGSIADVAEAAFAIGVGIMGDKGANPLEAVPTAGLALTITRNVTADPVGANAGEAFTDVATGLTQPLLGQADIGRAEMGPDTVGVIGTGRGTFEVIGRAQVRRATLDPPVETVSGTVTFIIEVLDAVGTVGRQTRSTIRPQPACPGTVTNAIGEAGSCRHRDTLPNRVGPVGHQHAAGGAIADLAYPALVVGVGIQPEGGTGPLSARHWAGVAGTVAGRITAVAVDALVRQTFRRLATGLAVGLLGRADIAQTVGVGDAVGIEGARRPAADPIVTALVRGAILGTGIDTVPAAITQIWEGLNRSFTAGSRTESSSDPEATGARAVAATVLLTRRFIGSNALAFDILPYSLRLTGRSPVAGLAETTFAGRVGISGVGRAGPKRTRHIAGFAGAIAGGVTAIAIHTLVTAALVVGKAGATIVLFEHASRTSAIVAALTVGMALTGIATLGTRFIADVGEAILRPGIGTDASPITLVRGMERVVHAGLLGAGGVARPESAGAGAVADTGQTTVTGITGRTFFFGVRALGSGLAGPGSVARVTQTTIGGGVGIVRLVVAAPFVARHRAVLADTCAVRFAADAIDAEGGQALVVPTTPFPIVLLGHATARAIAPVTYCAVAILTARGITVVARAIAGVRQTKGRATIGTGAGAVAFVLPIDNAVVAVLSDTNGARLPEAALARAITTAVLAASGRGCGAAIALGIFPGGRIRAATAPVADSTQTTVILRVGTGNVFFTGPGIGRAGLAKTGAGCIAAVTVDAVVGQAFAGAGTRLAVVLARHTGPTIAEELVGTVAIVAAARQAIGAYGIADVRRTVLGACVHA